MSIRSVTFVARKIQELPSTQVERYLAAYVRAVRLDEARAAFRDAVLAPVGAAGAIIDRLSERLGFLQRRAK